MNRRHFLLAAAGSAGSFFARADEPGAKLPAAVIDTHTHFYDPTRPQGVPWPGKDDKLLFRPVLPPEFIKLTRPLGVTGTVVVEASPWVEDNQWLLDLAAKDDFLLGIVGNLDLLSETFPKHMGRFARNPKFRGLRINHGPLQKGLDSKDFANHVAMLIDHCLDLDVNGGPDMPADVARLAQKFPKLRLVINHAANLRIDGKAPPQAWRRGMHAAARHPEVFCKVSALVEGTGRNEGNAPTDPAFYRPMLEVLWDAFGEDRLLYGSNWPVSVRFGSYATTLNIVRGFFQTKGERALRKFFGDNARRAYALGK